LNKKIKIIRVKKVDVLHKVKMMFLLKEENHEKKIMSSRIKFYDISDGGERTKIIKKILEHFGRFFYFKKN